MKIAGRQNHGGCAGDGTAMRARQCFDRPSTLVDVAHWRTSAMILSPTPHVAAGETLACSLTFK
jgi:hypothetical protein